MLLIYALLRLQALLRFQGQLWQSLDPNRRAVLLDWPGFFITKFATAIGVPVLGMPTQQTPQRIEMAVWLKAHVELGIQSFTWPHQDCLVLTVRVDLKAHDWETLLGRALGGATHVQIRPVAKKTEPRSLE